jgi:hypothetical protein
MTARFDIPHFFSFFFPLYWIWALSRALGALLIRQAFNVHYIMLSWLFLLLLLSPFTKQLCFDDLHVGSYDDLHVGSFDAVCRAVILILSKGRGVACWVVPNEHQAVIPEHLEMDGVWNGKQLGSLIYLLRLQTFPAGVGTFASSLVLSSNTEA